MSKLISNLDSVIFYTNDINKAIQFYTDLGLQLEFRDGEKYVSFLFPNDTRLGIKVASNEREIPGHQTLIASTIDIESLYKNLKDKKIVFYSELMKYDWGRHFSILDTDGNKIEFLQK